jgi:hypothetical protein
MHSHLITAKSSRETVHLLSSQLTEFPLLMTLCINHRLLRHITQKHIVKLKQGVKLQATTKELKKVQMLHAF